MKDGIITFGALFFFAGSMIVSAIFVPDSTNGELEPREYLKSQCQSPQCDFVLLDTIIDCESGWQMVKNRQSSAFGYFQILDSTEKTTPQFSDGQRKTDPYTNIDMGLYLYETRGSSPWNSSRGCWQSKYYYKMNTIPPECIGNCE